MTSSKFEVRTIGRALAIFGSVFLVYASISLTMMEDHVSLWTAIQGLVLGTVYIPVEKCPSWCLNPPANGSLFTWIKGEVFFIYHPYWYNVLGFYTGTVMLCILLCVVLNCMVPSNHGEKP